MRFRKRAIVVEANQYTQRGCLVQGMRSREDGTAYVVTAQGREVTVDIGEYVILESHDGTLAYPCMAEVFERSYERSDT